MDPGYRIPTSGPPILSAEARRESDPGTSGKGGTVGERISVVIPSRGLLLARCIDSVLRNLHELGVDYHLTIPSGYAIPTCFNVPIQNELIVYKPTHVWIVEEDVEVPSGGLRALLGAGGDISAIDYPFPNGYGCVAYYKGVPQWTGTGCTLIKRGVFEELAFPWFRTDIIYNKDNNGNFTQKIAAPGYKRYGGHDIHFGIIARHFGLSIKVVPNMTARHIKLKSMGKEGENEGQHSFTVYDHIQHPHVLRRDPQRALDKRVFLE